MPAVLCLYHITAALHELFRKLTVYLCALHRKKETWMDLLRCLSSQPQAAAQATALSMGAYHTAALMAQNPADPADLQLYAFGRGEPRVSE